MSKKITQLTEATALADGDKVPVVDISDVTQSVNGTTKWSSFTTFITFLISKLGYFTATSGNASTGKLVPSISSGDDTKFLNSLGAWEIPPDTTYSTMGSGNGYATGLVVAGSGTHNANYLRKDGTWDTIFSKNSSALPTAVMETQTVGTPTIGSPKEFTIFTNGHLAGNFIFVSFSGAITIVHSGASDEFELSIDGLGAGLVSTGLIWRFPVILTTGEDTWLADGRCTGTSIYIDNIVTGRTGTLIYTISGQFFYYNS
tara:strand:+ start:827 stop:1603 length:777 start_codon:yes stop_codon:yes gene_type:complete